MVRECVPRWCVAGDRHRFIGLRKARDTLFGMRAPLSKRWPIGLAILVGLGAGRAASHVFWVQAIVYIAVLIAAAFVLRFAFDWPWSRILRYRASAKP